MYAVYYCDVIFFSLAVFFICSFVFLRWAVTVSFPSVLLYSSSFFLISSCHPPHSRYFFFLLKCSLAVYSWGRGEDGQLGLGDTNDQYRPVLVDALKCKGVVQVACGSGHTVVLSGESASIISLCERQSPDPSPL